MRRPARGRARPRGAQGPQRGVLDQAVRRALPAHDLALRLGRVGQEGVGAAPHRRRERRVDDGGRDEPAVGRALRQEHRPARAVGEAVRGLAHRVVQGPGDDGAGVDGQADDRRRQADPRGRLRVDGRHLGGAGGLRGRRGHPRHGDPAARQDLDRAAGAAARQRRGGAGRRRRLRRLHGDGPAARRGGGRLPRQQHEQPARRGAEDRLDRDGPAVRLGRPRLGRDPGRQPRQRQRARRRLHDDAGSSASSRSCRASASRRRRPPTRSTAPTRRAGTSSSR